MSRSAIEFTVMTFNIKVGTPDDGPNNWEYRRGILLDCLRHYPADIIGTQEGLRFQLDAIKDEFPRFEFIGIGRYHGIDVDREHERGEGEHCAIFYDKTKLDVTRQGTFWLSDTPEIPGSMTWGNDLARIVTWAVFKPREHETPLCCFNTHFHWGDEFQRKSALLLNRRLRQIANDTPVVVLGDFNAAPESEPWKILTALQQGSGYQGQLVDCWKVLGKPETDGGTGHGFTGISNEDRIDWILVSRHFRVKAIDRIQFNQAGRYPSDHFPIRATLELSVKDAS